MIPLEGESPTEYIDRMILEKILREGTKYDDEGVRILECLRVRDQCPHDTQYTEEMIEDIKNDFIEN